MLLIFAVSARVAALLVTLYKMLDHAGLRPGRIFTPTWPLIELLAGFLELISYARK